MSNLNNLREGTDIQLAEKTVTVYPLTIRQLRKFMKILKDLNTRELTQDSMTDEDIDAMVDAAAIVLEKIDPELAGNKDALEDQVDIKSFNLMVAAAMGTDPNA